MSSTTTIGGKIIDIKGKNIFNGEVVIEDGCIKEINKSEHEYPHYILPGFIDAHIHIESSMLVPYEFAKIALTHGTIATISDPHEIANVCGIEGVEFMIDNAQDAGLKIFFGAPSCVPATAFETAGATINAKKIELLLSRSEILYLSEMMNYPGVLHEDPEVMAKINAAKKFNKPVDGHAPGLKGAEAKKYIDAGISTDHECFTLEEALSKLSFGMKIIIREGSAAKNFDVLHPLIKDYSDQVMFCSDDKHPDNLLEGHINLVVKRALELGYDLFDVLKIACINPIKHYKMPVGYLRQYDPADFIVVEDIISWKVKDVYIDGKKMVDNGNCVLPKKQHKVINQFNISYVDSAEFKIPQLSAETIPVIKAIDGALITEKAYFELPSENGFLQVDLEKDVLKICVINRYKKNPVAKAFIHGFGLKSGAIASSVAHDSHNIVVVGTNDEDITKAVNLIIKAKGGLSYVNDNDEYILPLTVAGLMHTEDAIEVAKWYKNIDKLAKNNGCTLTSPFMTLSFMALLVIPKLKISDLGLFDAENFEFLK